MPTKREKIMRATDNRPKFQYFKMEDINNIPEFMIHAFFKPCGCVCCAIANIPFMFDKLLEAQQRYRSNRYELMGNQEFQRMEWQCQQHKTAKSFNET